MNADQAYRVATFFWHLNSVFGPLHGGAYLVFEPERCVILQNPKLLCSHLRMPAVLEQLYEQVAQLQPQWWVPHRETVTISKQGMAPRLHPVDDYPKVKGV